MRFTRHGYGPQERSEDFEDLQVAILSRCETLSVLRQLQYTLLELYPSVLLRVCHTCNLNFTLFSLSRCLRCWFSPLAPSANAGKGFPHPLPHAGVPLQ